MRRLLAAVFLIVLAGAEVQAAGSVELGVNEESVQGRLLVPVVQDDYGSSEFNARGLYNEDEDLTLGSVGINFIGWPAQVPGLALGIGVEAMGGGKEDRLTDQDILALALGARLSYFPPGLNALGLHARVSYAPEVISFLETERVLETGLRASFAIIPRVDIFLEYQKMKIDFEEIDEKTVDEGIRIGMLARF